MQLYNLEFSEAEIRAAAAANRLLSMEIEFSRACNFRCVYCYQEDRLAAPNEMTPAEIREVLRQAKALGARKIIILGGEPTIYPQLPEMLDFLSQQRLQVELFTNGSGITAALASQLAACQVRVVLKLNSRQEAVQNRLAGKPGAHAIIQQALSLLRAAGYPGPGRFLAASTVICQPNIEELPDLWHWLRTEQIEPYFEILTPQANAARNNWLEVGTGQLHALFHQLAAIDRDHFNRCWEPQPPLVGNRCMRHQVSCLVNACGQVLPCVGITIPLGSIRQQPLAEILHHQVIRDLKNYRTTIKGPCASCEKSMECYGCRGAAYQLTGDYLASDPTCWRHSCQQATPAGPGSTTHSGS